MRGAKLMIHWQLRGNDSRNHTHNCKLNMLTRSLEWRWTIHDNSIQFLWQDYSIEKKRQLQRKTNSLAPAESLDGSQGVAAKEVPGRALSSPEMPWISGREQLMNIFKYHKDPQWKIFTLCRFSIRSQKYLRTFRSKECMLLDVQNHLQCTSQQERVWHLTQ